MLCVPAVTDGLLRGLFAPSAAAARTPAVRQVLVLLLMRAACQPLPVAAGVGAGAGAGAGAGVGGGATRRLLLRAPAASGRPPVSPAGPRVRDGRRLQWAPAGAAPRLRRRRRCRRRHRRRRPVWRYSRRARRGGGGGRRDAGWRL
ncbi:hypothetical protein BU14_0104s0003 [Porphyra umbilicalis]|uniref:Uncharacterized protein n=1 Tax=Porphyra umbilicalis TaxID=2786 RepID=A0A1X6PCI5_PORUM|nr:hypothetical protein BU14_0104s0003 [Porphyra umbilicalis]|eukprot:OSX78629.1 hypothetical protein BU14_0104s0003 [Porphyra umbilicalis]